MRRPSFDPGLTQQFTAPFRRAIEKDGSFNVHRRGGTWRDFHPYLHLINMSWPGFLATLFAGYLAANTVFAAAYFALGPGQLQGGDAATAAGRFLNGFFFSAHTLSTVGYGSIAPRGLGAQIVSSLEALTGVLGFAVATGLLFGRVSRPSARIGFSENMLITPYQDGMSLQFRVVNRRRNSLMELEARVMLMTVEVMEGQPRRTYKMLRLEREQVIFLPLTWTIVHPIDAESPLWGKTAEDLASMQAEALILIKAYDDTFSQSVHARYSYRHDEIVWGKRFTPAFFVDSKGDMVVDLRKVGELA
ncbi:MAG: ion channel [Bryobacteraceae bacterium]|jgi:inward rectifier potassium channel